MKVPLLDLSAQNGAVEIELRAAFVDVLQSGQFILGAEVAEFEEECAEFLGVDHAVGVSSGTDALIIALMALGIGPGDEVICPSFTFFATAGSVSRVGATPVFADSCGTCFNLDLDDLKAKITPKTKAIIPVHLFGQMAEMDGIMAIAEEHELEVIEDAAQAFGASQRGKKAGSIGKCGTMSFFPTKNLGGFGDGGLVTTNDGDFAARLKDLRNHGMNPKYHHHLIGGNFRIDALQAALLRVKLPHLESYCQLRAANAAEYTRLLSRIDGVVKADQADCGCPIERAGTCSSEGAKLVLPVAYDYNDHIWNQYTLRVMDGRRDELREALLEAEIGCEIYYPRPMHWQECFSELPGVAELKLPVCEQLAGEVISLPVFPELTGEQIEHVVETIADFL